MYYNLSKPRSFPWHSQKAISYSQSNKSIPSYMLKNFRNRLKTIYDLQWNQCSIKQRISRIVTRDKPEVSLARHHNISCFTILYFIVTVHPIFGKSQRKSFKQMPQETSCILKVQPSSISCS